MLASARVWVAALAASLRRCRARMFMDVAASAGSSRGRDAGARARRFLGFLVWVRC